MKKDLTLIHLIAAEDTVLWVIMKLMFQRQHRGRQVGSLLSRELGFAVQSVAVVVGIVTLLMRGGELAQRKGTFFLSGSGLELPFLHSGPKHSRGAWSFGAPWLGFCG